MNNDRYRSYDYRSYEHKLYGLADLQRFGLFVLLNINE